ncbi:hypothetical protein AB0F92_37890 [Kitasatospora aureofaciens]|uniref:hypothetical protein n=1 Tax=Kitasatospora aureofaciens TaxID=1894 RepID=UPI0033CC662B
MGKRYGPAGGRWLLRAVLTLAGLALVVLSFLRFHALDEDGRAFRTAPLCAPSSAAPHADCVRLETGRVTGKRVDDSGDTPTYDITVGREKAQERTVCIDFSFYKAVEPGATVELRIWNGRVVAIAFDGRTTEPADTPWLSMVPVGLLAGVGTALLVAGLAGPGRDRSIPYGLATLFSAASWFGGAVLLTVRWPVVVTLGVPALIWLVITVFAVEGSRSAPAPYGRPSQAGTS